jgi:hypothetical protein
MTKKRMTTNKVIPRGSGLCRKGKRLLKAAHDYWLEYQTSLGSCAVVWLEADDGHFVLFTRGEYKEQIMTQVRGLYGERPLVNPFEKGKS